MPERAAQVQTMVVEGGPQGFDASHAAEFDEALIAFLAK